MCELLLFPPVLIDVTGNDKSKMAATKPKILVSRLSYKIAAKFQRLHPHFRVQQHGRTLSDIEDSGKSKMAAITGSINESSGSHL